MRSTVRDASLGDAARAIERRAHALRDAISGDERRDQAGDPGPVSISRRLSVAVMGNRSSTYGPTPTHLESFAICESEFAVVREELDRILREDLPRLEARLDAEGVPWTPGRAVPGGK